MSKPFFVADKTKAETKLYLMWFKFRGLDELVYKVGVTQNEPIDRMLTILRSFYMNKKNRYVPEAYIKRFRVVSDPYKKEAAMLEYFKEYKYEAEDKFDGCTEMFIGLDEEELLTVYERCVNGEEILLDKRTKNGRIDKDVQENTSDTSAGEDCSGIQGRTTENDEQESR